MKIENRTLPGRHVRLESLEYHHVDGLVAAAAADPTLYQWSPVPQGVISVMSYVGTALAWRDAGTAAPFAIIRVDDEVVIGSTRFWNLEHWAWPQGHSLYGRDFPDAGEIGYTWLTRSAIRTAANTETKLLLLTHAFEVWRMLRVCFHADARATNAHARRSNALAVNLKGSFALTGWPLTSLRVTRRAFRSWPRNGRRSSVACASVSNVSKRD